MAPALGFAWRLAALGGLAVGLALSPLLGGPARGPELAIAAAAAAALLSATAPRGRAGSALGARAWVGLVAAAALAAGLGIGSLRVAAIDAGALRLAPGGGIEVGGFVTAVPRRARGMVRARVATPAGRLLVEAPEPVADLDIGAAVSAAGRLRAPAEFERGYLERLGIARVLSARSIELRDGARTGLTGALDRVRERAQGALSAGTPDRSAALLRGFVLGQDDRIDAATVDEFKRSGLAHLLAVSGQNVVLLAILATALLGALGVGLRARLVCILGLIGLYVLVTGAGPSIQRAGLMGAAGLIAALAGRPSSRWYALGLAAAATLAIDPRAAGDVGWQLSFAAVLGILLGTAPLSRALAGTAPGRARRALAEAAAMTTAATAATAPLMSFHFGTVSLVSLPANLVAVPAEAPVMWLGMLAAAAGQVEWLPVEPITWLAGLLAAYIAQVADWFAAPGWAQVELGLGGPAGLFGAYAALGAALALAVRSLGRRAALAPGRRAARVAGAVAGFALAAAALAGLAGAERPGFPAPAVSSCGCSTSARAMRSCCARPAASRCSSTPGRRAPGSPSGSTSSGSTRWPRWRSPTPTSTIRAGRRRCSPRPGSRGCWSREPTGRCSAPPPRPARGCGGSPPEPRFGPAACGSRCSGPGPAPGPRSRTRARWSCSPGGAVSGSCSAATRRPSWHPCTPGTSMCSRSPTTGARTPGWCAC